MAEVPQMEMRARLSADTAQFTKGMQDASASMNEFTQNSSKLRGAMVGVGAASAGFTAALIAFGTQSFMAAARIEELDYAMDAIGKSTGKGYQAIKDAANAIKSEGIEMEVASQAAIKFAQNNLDLSQAHLLATAAQDFAIVGAKNSTETFNMLTHAVITGRSEVLKSVGIQKSAGQMYEDFAKTLGKSAAALTYQEKQQAVLAGALKEGENVAGAYAAAMQSPGKVLRSFPRMINNIQISMGNMLLKGIGPIVFHMYEFIKSFSKAIDESVAFQLVIEAVKQVVIKVSAPFVAFFKHLKTMLDGLTRVTKAAEGVKSNFEPVGDAVKNLATKIEFLMPAIAALLAMFATFAGAALFANVPVLGALLGTLAGPIGIIVVGLATLYITSNQVKDAFNKLFSSLSPIISVIVSVGKALATAAGFGVAIFAKAISGLATVIKSTTTFLTQHRVILNGIKYVLAVLIASYVAYKAIMLGQLAVTKISTIAAAVHAKMTRAQAVATAQAALAQANNTTIVATHTAAVARANVVNAAHAFALSGTAVNASALSVAEMQLTGATTALSAATAKQTAAQASLTAVTAPFAFTVFGVVLAISALVIAFVIAWKQSETFREVMTKVFNFVANIVGKVLGFIFNLFGNLLLGFGNLIDINNTFGKVVAGVIQFVYQAYLTWYIFIIKAIKSVIDAWLKVFDNQTIFAKIVAGVVNFVIGVYATLNKFFLGIAKSIIDAFLELFKTNETFRTLVETVFNVVIKIIAHAVTVIVMVLANIIKVIATLIYYFEQFGKFIAEIWGNVVAAIDKAKEFIGNIFKKIGDALGSLVDWFKDKFADMFEWLAKQADKIPDFLGGGKIASALNTLAASVRGVKEESGKSFLDKMGDAIATGAKKAIELVSAVDKKLIDASKSWGNYEGGAAGALSKIANKMLDFSAKVTEFSDKDNGSKIVAGFISAGEKASTVLGTMIKGFTLLKDAKFGDKILEGLVKTANGASDGLGKVISGLEKMKDVQVGKFIVENTSKAAVKAGEFLIGLGAGIESFTESDFVNKIGDGFGDLIKSLKTGLGFGDIMEDLKKEFSLPGLKDDDAPETAAETQAKRLDAIRESMKSAIESIKGVLDDLRQAAKDFADSLKDTIVGFAGLKSIELPDGFIPKAKSLITNMEQRLNKSVQFASQIAQLQAMNLDANALKSIIEEGPIKGAQLAASILGGGQVAVNEVSRLQKQIEFAGARIGAFGAEAAFGGQIEDASRYLASMEGKDLVTSSRGNNVYIQQGAFQLNVDVSKGKDDEERTAMIAAKIEETFAILARQLASK